MDFTDKILEAIIIAEDEGKVTQYEDKFYSVIKEEELSEAKKKGIDNSLLEFKKITNGFKLNWWHNSEKGIGGALNFNSIKFLLKDEQSLIDECEMDPDMDQELRHFRILDNPTMNSQVGFFALPSETPSRAIHFRMAGDKWTENLDLDFKGYLEMALISKVYFNWQLVLVDIKNNKESPETKIFKQYMPKVFSDFNWNDFVNKYQSLRFSKQ